MVLYNTILQHDEGSDNELTWNDGEDDELSGNDNNSSAEQNGNVGKKRKQNNTADIKQRKKFRRERHVAAPTAEEMIHLRETETLFKSNLFRLEIEEMLKEIKPVKSFQNAANVWIENFKRMFKKIDEDDEWIHVSETDWLNNINVQLPLPDLGKMFDGAYKFLKPADVKAVGSFYVDCTMGPKFDVDVAVVTPKGFYRKKDYLNQTYHYKRALYLCAIAGHLQNSGLVTENSPLKFTCVNGDTLKPVLVVNPSGKGSDKIEILIHVIPEEETFPLKRFIPSSNNVRETWWGCQNISELAGTPLYNTSIVEDLVLESNERLREESFKDNENMKDAVRLLRVWLRQRNLDQGSGAFSTYIMSMVVLYLKDKQKINKHMSSYQIIRNVWLYLSQSNWCQEGASLCKAEAGSTPAISVFHGYFDTVFVDPSGYVNLAARLNKLTYLKVRSESVTAIELLDSTEVNGFQALFMVKMPFILQYDHIFSFTDDSVIYRTSDTYMSTGSDMDLNGNPLPLFTKLVSDLLQKGLRDRVIEINLELVVPDKWQVNLLRPSPISGQVTFGMRLHSEYGLNIIDKGPQANLPEATEFREFWGDKSELRRFKDGTVCECTVWDDGTPTLSKRFLINRDIVAHLMKNHLGILPNDYSYIANQLDYIIEPRIYDIPAEEACLKIHKSLEELSRQLTELDNLPLEVTTVHCISSSYQYADVFPPLPCFRNKKFMNNSSIWTFTPGGCVLADEISRTPPYVAPIDLVLQMTFTRSWPNDLTACRRLTAAFYIAIANQLQQKHKLKFILHADCLLVEKDGLMFRLYLGYSKEIALLKLNVTEDGVKQYRDTPESLELERKFINLPNLTGALHGLSVAEPGFGGSTRLVKRWLSSHMLDSFHFPPVLAELMVASLLIKPQPFKRLLQPQQIFLRFLNMMASTNWHTELLIVNFNNILTKEEIRGIERKFQKERSSFPPLVIATAYDKTGTLWTRRVPTLSTLVRIAKLASGTLEILQAQLSTVVPNDRFASLFTPNLNLYDVVISLKYLMLPRRFEKISFTPKKKAALDLPVVTLPVTDFDPPQIYLQYLRDHYDEFALFFYDTYGGSAVGVLFRPNMFDSSEFKVNSLGGKMPNHDADPVCLKTNFKSIINDFKEIGEGLVGSITLNHRIQNIINS